MSHDIQRRAYGEPGATPPFVRSAPEEPDDDLTTCPDCGSHEITANEDMIRAYVTEYRCNNCGNLRRREA